MPFRHSLWAALLLVLLAPVAMAQTLPERFATTRANTDFPGGDLTPIFNTTQDQCLAACLRLSDCAGFTFNQRNGACFPKSVIGQSVPYEGALSAIVQSQAPDAQSRAAASRARLTFLDADDFSTARDQAQGMALRFFANGMTEAALLDGAIGQGAAERVLWTGAAVTVADSGAAWLAHARALLDQATGSDERFGLLNRATHAAINATLRHRAPQGQAQALALMARALDETYRSQAALGAARLADTLQPGIMGDDLLRLREQHGFRMLSQDVQSQTSAPRICATFSEALAPTRDYTPFVQSTLSGLALEVEGSQLCLTGAEYGQSLRVTLRAGLPAASGEALARDIPLDIYIRDRTPLVRFPGRGYVLPATGPRALPVETVNANRLDLRLLRVSDRNLVTAIRQGDFAAATDSWQAEQLEQALTEAVWTGTAQLEGALNRAATARLPLDEAGELQPGVYILRAAVPGTDSYNAPPALQWFMISDLGLSTFAGTDGLHVVVQSMSDAQPVAGLKVSLLARSNRVLGVLDTDAQGHVRFGPGLMQGRGQSAPALVQVEGQGDMAVLSLADPEFDLSDRGVEGRVAPGAVDVFLTTDRGAYRPSEVIFATALARDARVSALHGLPLTARLLRPDGVEYARAQAHSERTGGHVFQMGLGADVPRGIWRLEVLADPTAPALAAQTVLVEDFLPERVDMALTLPEGALDPAIGAQVSVSARHLFGAPASAMPLDGTLILRATDTLAAWPGFRFGRHDQRVDPLRRSFGAQVQTGGDGTATLDLPLSGLSLDARPYNAQVIVSLRDGAARPVERDLTRELRPSGPILGIRPGFDGVLPENAEARFDLVALSPDLSVQAEPVTWQIDRVETRFQWFSVDGRWNWEPVTERIRVAEGVAEGTGPVTITAAVGAGGHEIRVSHSSGASASMPFAAGWYAAASARETPDMLPVTLDRDRYAPGDTARLRLTPAGAGMALVTVLADRLVDMRLVAVEGETTLDLPVTEDWGPGVYVTASLIRPAGTAELLPARALGLAHAAIDPGARALNAVLTAPLEADPRGPLTVTLDLPDFTDGPAYATLAAVDLGILTLTGFQAPDPMGHYFGQRRLGVALRDIYGRLIDARAGVMGQVRSGGDGGASARSGPAPTEDLLAQFAGPILLENGRAEVTFDLPAFNGTVRVMAVVWSDKGIGQASADVLVRDPVVVQASPPRFLTPGDTSRLRLELSHAKGPAGEMGLVVTGHGLGAVPASVTLAEGQGLTLDLALAPTDVGEHTYDIVLTTPDGQRLSRSVRLSVQHTDPEIARTSQFTLAPGQSFTFDQNALDGLRSGTGRATLVAGAGAALDMPGLIQHLRAYPYGCTEQITSGLQPLLVAGDRLAALGLMDAATQRATLQDGIARLLTRQGANGSFGLWRAGGFELWLDAYVTEALLRAEELGVMIPDAALRSALNNLRNQVAQAGGLYDSVAGYAYAFAVLARAGEAAIGDLRYYADTLAERFDTPLSAAQMGAALAAYGEQARADAMFRQAASLAAQGEGDLVWRGDYGTALRDKAGLLALAVQSGSAAIDRVQLASQLALRPDLSRLSTQEAYWSLAAAQALGAESSGLSLDGQPVQGNVVQALDGTPRLIRNDGASDVVITVTAFGVPDVAPPAQGQGYMITRSYFTTDGQPADLSRLRVGDRVVTVLEVRPDIAVPGGRLMIDDALPAGLEIDIANLLRAGDIRALDWLSVTEYAEATEARADRFLAAVDWTSRDTLRLAYIARAVSEGDFHHPAAKVEDMYRPSFRAITGTGRVSIMP
ncbi:MAG: alpha-2-macroglobulin family protein [Roseinatronobacter sp.]